MNWIWCIVEIAKITMTQCPKTTLADLIDISSPTDWWRTGGDLPSAPKGTLGCGKRHADTCSWYENSCLLLYLLCFVCFVWWQCLTLVLWGRKRGRVDVATGVARSWTFLVARPPSHRPWNGLPLANRSPFVAVCLLFLRRDMATPAELKALDSILRRLEQANKDLGKTVEKEHRATI